MARCWSIWRSEEVSFATVLEMWDRGFASCETASYAAMGLQTGMLASFWLKEVRAEVIGIFNSSKHLTLGRYEV